jgi:hypothetical protein
MQFIPASDLSVATFILIILFVSIFVLTSVYSTAKINGQSAERKTLFAFFIITLWAGSLTALTESGFLKDNPLPGIPLFFGIVILGAIGFSFSRIGSLLMSLPLSMMVLFQAFRLPLEIVLHSWAIEGTVPSTMTWSGENFDIITGVACLILAFWTHKFKAAAWIANILGSILLLNVIRVAMLSSPVPFGWDLEKPLLLAFHFPYLLIAPMCVGAALCGHIILTRRLLADRKQRIS